MQVKFSLIFIIALFAPLVEAAPVLHSLPEAHDKLFLDCDTYPWTAPDDVITRVWQIVAGIYAPFNVDVTTVNPSIRPDAAWVVVGGPLQAGGVAGRSVIGGWHTGVTDPAFASFFDAEVYADGLGNDPVRVALAIAHEAGHSFGLQHQPSGIMAPVLGTELPLIAWPNEVNVLGVAQDSYGYLGGQLGFAVVPEPSLVVMVGLLCVRGRRSSNANNRRAKSLSHPEGGPLDKQGHGQSSQNTRARVSCHDCGPEQDRRQVVETAKIDLVPDWVTTHDDMPKVDGVAVEADERKAPAKPGVEEVPRPSLTERSVNGGQQDRSISCVEQRITDGPSEAVFAGDEKEWDHEGHAPNRQRSAPSCEFQRLECASMVLLDISKKDAKKETVDPQVGPLVMDEQVIRHIPICEPEGEAGEGDNRRHENQSLKVSNSHQKHEQQGQQKVKVLLDGERPCVSLRDVSPIVLKVNEVRQELTESFTPALSVSHSDVHGIGDQREVWRPNLPSPSREESGHIEATCFLDFLEEQTTNQVTAEHKKQVNTRPSDHPSVIRRPLPRTRSVRSGRIMVKEDQQNREAAQHVQLKNSGPRTRRASLHFFHESRERPTTSIGGNFQHLVNPIKDRHSRVAQCLVAAGGGDVCLGVFVEFGGPVAAGTPDQKSHGPTMRQ
jgi:hypothetical protein